MVIFIQLLQLLLLWILLLSTDKKVHAWVKHIIITYNPIPVQLSHENKAISRYELMKAPGQPDDVMDYFRLENEGVVGSSGAIALKQIKPLDRETV